MNEIIIGYNKESPQKKDAEIKMNILDKPKEGLLFKFVVGFDGSWEILRDFDKNESVIWNPKREGKYILMVQAKEKDSIKSFDYISKYEYTIGNSGNEEATLIKDIYLNKKEFHVGEKVHIKVECKKDLVLYRYLIKENEKWILAKDYCDESEFSCSVKTPGTHEILVQCKSADSSKKFEDAEKVQYKVAKMKKLEIKDFKCLTSELLVDEELVFEVDAEYDDSRMILYKFIKLSSDGQAKCIQDYSTKKIISYKEEYSDNYKLLCLVKDMYSPKEYDDRAILHYEVKAYRKVEILSFTSDLSSPQIMGKNIIFKAVVSGGKDLRYRYVIEGEKSEDSRYVKSNEYVWEPKEHGEYKVTLYSRDASCREKYEDSKTITFCIDEIPREPVKINEVIMDKSRNMLLGDSAEIKVSAVGGIKLLYSFLLKKDSEEIERVDYNECNWLNFTPDKIGKYEVEIRVKDKYSDKLYDSHEIIYIEAYKYIPAKIDYILMEPREYYLIGDQVLLNVITQDTNDTLLKYVLLINGHKVEETDYIKSNKYILTPKCSGNYVIKVYGKNEKSDKSFDTSKDIHISVNEALPITNTKLKCDSFSFSINTPVEVTAESSGGKDVIYEFYLMQNKEWNLVQKYSKKNYYNFIPFTKGIHKILVLAKSSYRKISYEDYCIIKIKVTDNLPMKPLMGDKEIEGIKRIKEIVPDDPLFMALSEEEVKTLI